MTQFYALTPTPDARKLAYFHGDPDNLSLVWQRLDEPSAPQVLLSGLRCSTSFMRLVWSRNTHSLFYAADDDGNWFHDVWRIDLLTGQRTQLTDYFQSNSYPLALHPQAETLLVMSNLRGEMNVRTLILETKDFRKITDYAYAVRGAVYSPDGRFIAYAANATDNPHNSDLYLMSGDGFDKRKLLSTGAGTFDGVQGWSANGRWLGIESNFEGYWQAGVIDLRDHSIHWLAQLGAPNGFVGFAPEGAQLLLQLADGLHLYALETDEHTALHALGGVVAAAWGDANSLIVGTANGQLLRYTLADGQSTLLPTLT